MLMPFEWAILTVEDARFLESFIREELLLKSKDKKFTTLWSEGLGKIYNNLREFIARAEHYEGELRSFIPYPN